MTMQHQEKYPKSNMALNRPNTFYHRRTYIDETHLSSYQKKYMKVWAQFIHYLRSSSPKGLATGGGGPPLPYHLPSPAGRKIMRVSK